MSKIAVILAGAGVKDGSEIHEATLTLFFLDELGCDVQCFAPNRNQYHVVNHLTDEESLNSERNILTEAARIARGNVLPIDKLVINDYDAIIFPGGFGSAKNLCNYAIKGQTFDVFPDISKVIIDGHQAKKVMGFICIAPVMAAKLIPGVRLTVGHSNETVNHVKVLGASHQDCPVEEVVWDQVNQVVSTPAYMLGPSIKDIGAGIRRLCQTVHEKCNEKLIGTKR